MTADIQNLLPFLHESLQQFLHNWRDDLYATPLSRLAIFRAVHFSSTFEAGKLVRETIQRLLSILEQHNPVQADLLRVRFLAGKSVMETCNELHVAEGTFYKVQNSGLDWMVMRLGEMEIEARAQQRQQLQLRLDAPSNTNLVGVEVPLLQLVTWLSSNEPPWLIALEGMGGIGKTALANVVMRHLIGLPGYVDFAWVTARQSHLDLGGALRLRQRPALTSEALIDQLVDQLSEHDFTYTSLPSDRKLAWLQGRLKQQPHLLVLDNLETVQDLETLLPLLQKLCNPSRFLLTTRHGLENEANLAHFQISPLDEANSLALLRQEAQIRKFPELLAASDGTLRPIFETVGGNPLALRLVVGQLVTDTITAVLDDLHQGRGEAVENLYTYIYRRAYDRLDSVARDVWLALTLVVTPLATAEMLARASRQDEHDVRRALQTLTYMNLVDCHGDLERRTFSIHSLTRTFLEKQIGKWKVIGG